MVRKKTVFSPLYSIALVALTVFYVLTSSFFQRKQGLFFSQFLLLFSILCLFFIFTFFCIPFLFNINSVFLIQCSCLFLGIFCGSFGALNWFTTTSPIKTLSSESQIVSIYGTLISDPQSWGRSWYRLDVSLDTVEVISGARYSAKGNCSLLLSCDQVRSVLPGGISPKNGQRQYLSKGLNIGVSGSFSSEDHSFFIGTNLLQPELNISNNFISSSRALLRLSLIKLLYEWKDSGAFLLALLSGNRDFISPELSLAFRRAGLSHILALSGMHLSLMGIVAIKIGKRIGGKRLGIKLSFIAMCFFVWFAGSSPSLNRALIMSVLAIVIQLFGIPVSVLPILAATTIIQTIFIPKDVLSLAFLLSCSALWGIIVFGGALSSFYTNKLPEKIFSGFSASIGAQLMTAPIVSFTFKILCPIGIFASWLVSPLASIFLIFGMFCIPIALLIPPLHSFCGFCLNVVYQAVAIPASFFAHIPPLSFSTLISTICAALIPFFAGIFLTVFSLRYKKRRTPDDSFARL
ncbi:MAG TPA: ComEC/Rec2 family competence protein [Treponemataceae bacterium]|nr:ComEC/Rec2 family competence protein [Treponemataceae bacterium]